MAYQTINQTDATHLAEEIIAISAEVKKDGSGETESLVQLITWVTAHFSHLQLLLNSAGSKAKLPTLPLLQIIGRQWNLIFAERRVETGEILLHTSVELGSSNSILGIYQILASIRRLARWTSETYRPWWTLHVLGFDKKEED
ncbi:MAG: hypothetical protein Q9184_008545 [Pyrenodesmia sp. 2 TL-2023]